MANLRWLLAISVALAAMVVTTTAEAATIRDSAGMFSPAVVKKLEADLERLERATKIPVVIETIDAIPGLDKDASKAVRSKAIEQLAVKRDQAIRDEGVYLLISKQDRVFSRALIRERYAALLPIETRDAIRDALIAEFKKGDYDAGLTRAVETIEHSLQKATVANRGVKAPGVLPRRAAAGQSTMGTFLMILLGIVGVLIVLRVLGGLLNRSGNAGYPGQMGGMQRPGMGPGQGYYGGGGGGYGGGGGGGFFSSLMGGIGGAVAGNWLYDQFSGRHGNVNSSDMYSHDAGAGIPDQGGDAIIGADDDPGGGTSWDDGGGNDAGGGDWGGGGGGDWGGGGGGGDWGGGGGDGGGGDW
jgi:uncharacterized membrane protein YgcG